MFEKYRDGQDAYIIAEVGQNHQGDIFEALKYISEFARCGANAVKFQMRNNEYLFSNDALNRPYEGVNSFGATYGEHRDFLEFSSDDWLRIKSECKKQNVDFMCTAFDEPSLEQLVNLDVDILKVASFDLGNLPFLEKVIQTGKPVVFSIGGGAKEHINATINLFIKEGADFSILHCVSEYPCSVDRLGLMHIQELKNEFPNVSVGLSDHFNGILSGPIGYTLGARVFEKHVTFNRSHKGTDHSFALETRGFESFVRDIRRVPLMYKSKPIEELGTEYVFKKLGKSICANQKINNGEIFSTQNLSGIIHTEAGIPVRDAYKLLGKKANKEYSPRELIDMSQL